MACAIFVMSVYVLWVIFKRLVVLQNSFAVKCVPRPFYISFEVKLMVHALFHFSY